MAHDPTAYDITHGFDDDVLAGLEQHQLDAITTLLARSSERAYRRGFQQGSTLSRLPEARANLHDWRYGVSADDSPWADAPRIETSADRLFTENRELARLGLRAPVYDAIAGDCRRDPTYVPIGR